MVGLSQLTVVIFVEFLLELYKMFVSYLNFVVIPLEQQLCFQFATVWNYVVIFVGY